MRRLLPLFFLLLILFSFFSKAYAQSPTSVLNGTTVHSQGLLDDFFAWLGGILYKNQIPRKVCDVNIAGSPLNGVSNDNCRTSGTVSTQANDQSGNANEALKQSSREYDTAADSRTPYVPPSVDNRNFIQQWWESLTLPQVVPIGTEQSKKLVSTNLPFGVVEKVLPTPSDENSAMAFALDCKKDSTLPVGANPDSKCIPTNQPVFASPTPTPTPTPTITPTPEIGIYPTGGVSYDSCPVGNDKCVSKAQQEAGKLGNPDYYRRNKCYWQNFLSVFGGNEVKARAASAICFRESGGDVINVNDHCLPKYPVNQRTQDYSVGLFQINLLAHCPGALRDDWNTYDRTTNQPMRSCTVLDQAKLTECYNRFTTVDGAVAKMLELSKNGTDWHDWLTRRPDLYCEVTNKQMECVPPSLTPVPNTPPSGNYVQYLEGGQPYSSIIFGGGNQFSCDRFKVGCTYRIGNCGCGLITIASILSTYVSSTFTPALVNDLYYKSHSGCYSSFDEFFVGLNANKINYFAISGSSGPATDRMITDWRNFIKAGNKLFAAAYIDTSQQTNVGHFFWITDIDDNGKIYVMDGWRGPQSPAPIYQWDPRTLIKAVRYQKVYTFTPPKR